MEFNKNTISLTGTLKNKFWEFSHEGKNGAFCRNYLKVKRLSDYEDQIEVVLPKSYLDNLEKLGRSIPERVNFTGAVRAHSYFDDEQRRHLRVYVDAKMATIVNLKDDINRVELEGTICRLQLPRETPFGRRISDFSLAVNRGKFTDYIPCITWGQQADLVQSIGTGAKVSLCGRLQSRIYIKDGQERVAYEVSVKSITI